MEDLKLCDLHTHSTFSDGTLTPTEIVKQAKKLNLCAVALTDHNTISGLTEFINAAKLYDIEAVPGVEFSTMYNGKEIHLVALFVKENDYDKITNKFKVYDNLKEESNLKLVKDLNDHGMKIDYDKLKSSTPDGRINRANIASELANKGYVSSISEAFKTVLSKEKGFYVEPPKPETFDIIKFIKELGCVAVFAHPLLKHTKEELEEILPKAKECGLDAMEVFYSEYNDEKTELAISLAKKYNLLQSGGSDFHGANKPNIQLGTGKNNLQIPYVILQNLKNIL